MHVLLICPTTRPAVPALTRQRPLVLTPCLGHTPLEHALTALADAGAKQVTILATDRPAEVRKAVGRGEAWGLKIDVVPEATELSRDQARAKYGTGPAAPAQILTLDELPQLPNRPLWAGYRPWFETLHAFVSQALRHRVGMREIQPGVWVGLRSRIAPDAKLTGPVWIGANVWIGPQATIGPHTIIEDDCYVDESATVAGSVIGPHTYVGAMTEVRNSFAWGADLLNLDTGSVVTVPDRFLLSAAGPPVVAPVVSWPARLLALVIAVLTCPVVAVAWWRCRGTGQPLFATCAFVRGGGMGGRGTGAYRELPVFRGWWRRWPQLGNVARGEFAWVGNRPLTPAQAAELQGDFEQLWLAVPTGLFSLADALGCREVVTEEARVHASFFAVDPGRHKCARVLWRLVCRVGGGRKE